MPALITLEEANDHLRLDLQVVETSPPTYEDDRIAGLVVKMDAAEAIIFDYLKLPDPTVLDGSPPSYSERDLTVIKAAVLLLLSALWDDAPERTVADYMAIPFGTVPLLLCRLRDPTLA